MTPTERKNLIDLFYAAFEMAHEKGQTPSVDLMHFGKYLRVLESGFSPQKHGHEKLLYLLRDFPDLLYIRKDAEVSPPRYYVALRRNKPRQLIASPRPAAAPCLLEPQWVAGDLVERYLELLAQSSAQLHARLDAQERQLTTIQRELEQSRVNEVRLNTNYQDYERQLAVIKREQEQSRANETRLNQKIQEHERLLTVKRQK